jgi:hypothetical protein
MFRSSTRSAAGRAARLALAAIIGIAGTAAVHGQAAQPQAAKNPYVFASDGAIVLNFVKSDKTADFEMVMAKIKEALAKSSKPERKQQAASWKLFKAGENGPGGSAIYVSVMEPAVKGADYSVGGILSEGFPQDVQTLYKAYTDSFGTPAQNILNLTLNVDFSK